MTTFDQRGQKVKYQYNAVGNINFESVQHLSDVVSELQNLQSEVLKATQAGVLSEEIAADVEASIKKAVVQAQKPKPDKKTTMDYIDDAKALIEGVAAATGLVTGFIQAAEMVNRLF